MKYLCCVYFTLYSIYPHIFKMVHCVSLTPVKHIWYLVWQLWFWLIWSKGLHTCLLQLEYQYISPMSCAEFVLHKVACYFTYFFIYYHKSAESVLKHILSNLKGKISKLSLGNVRYHKYNTFILFLGFSLPSSCASKAGCF